MRGALERGLQLIERRLARRQRFCIAHELEARVDGIADDVREVIEIKGGDVLGAILQPQRTKGPVERVAFVLLAVDVVLERCKARAFGQVMPRSDTMSQAGIATLQKSNGRRDCGAVGLEVLGEEARGGRVLFAGQRAHLPVNRLHALHREQLERQGDGEIGLFRFEAARAQEPGEIRRRRIRRVELRHRRNDRQNAHFAHV